MGMINEGIRTFPVASAADIGAYLLVSLSGGYVTPYVKGSGLILQGSTCNTSENGYIGVKPCNYPGTRLLALDAGETLADEGWFTNGVTPGTIAPVGAGEPILGYCIKGATSGATTNAILECVLLDGLAAVADVVVNGELPNFPVGPVVPAT